MTKQNISKTRLVLNGICSFSISIMFLALGLPGLFGFITGAKRMGMDPDGGDKVLLIQIFSSMAGIIALVSLVRTVRAWRRLPKT